MMDQKVMISKNLLNNIEHELCSINGLFACDNQKFEEVFKLDCSSLLKKIEEEKHFQLRE